MCSKKNNFEHVLSWNEKALKLLPYFRSQHQDIFPCHFTEPLLAVDCADQEHTKNRQMQLTQAGSVGAIVAMRGCVLRARVIQSGFMGEKTLCSTVKNSSTRTTPHNFADFVDRLEKVRHYFSSKQRSVAQSLSF